MKSEHGAQFIAARDSRNRKIPGLQIRNGKFYGYLWAETEADKRTPRRVPLSNEGDGMPCSNLAEAKTSLEILRGDRRENKLPAPGMKPGFESWKALASNKASRPVICIRIAPDAPRFLSIPCPAHKHPAL